MVTIEMPNFKKYAGLALVCTVGVAATVLWLRSQGVDEVKTATERERDHAAFQSSLIEEMDRRFADSNDALDAGRFRIGTSTAFIGAAETEDRLNEARQRLGIELKMALKYAGLKPGENPRFEAGWYCATWLLDGPKGNTAEGLLGPTVAAYNAGDFGTVIERCAGAEATAMAQGQTPNGDFHFLRDISPDWTPPPVPVPDSDAA